MGIRNIQNKGIWLTGGTYTFEYDDPIYGWTYEASLGLCPSGTNAAQYTYDTSGEYDGIVDENFEVISIVLYNTITISTEEISTTTHNVTYRVTMTIPDGFPSGTYYLRYTSTSGGSLSCLIV